MTTAGRNKLDGGWGYMVAIAGFIFLFGYGSMLHTVGVYLVEWHDCFDVSGSLLSVITSEFTLGFNIPALFAGALCTRFGCRPVLFLAASLATISAFLGSFASTFWQLNIFAIVCSSAVGLMYVPAVVMPTYYFEKRLGLVNGIIYSSVGVAAFSMAPLIETMCDKYGWQGALLVHAAILGNTLVAAALCRPTEQEKSTLAKARGRAKSKVHWKRDEVCTGVEEKGFRGVSSTDRKGYPKDGDQNGKTSLIRESQSLDSAGDRIICKEKNGTRNSSTPEGECVFNEETKQPDPLIQTRIPCAKHPSEHDSPVFRGKPGSRVQFWKSVPEEQSEHNITETKQQNQVHEEVNDLRPTPKWGCPRWLLRLDDAFALSYLLRNGNYFAFLVSSFLTCTCLFAARVFIPSKLVFDLGIPKYQASLAITVFGICNCAARLVNGIIVDIRVISPINFFIFGLTTVAVSVGLNPFAETLWSQMILMSLLGFGTGNFYPMMSIISMEYVPPERLSNALGLLFSTGGISSVIGSQLIGGLYDATGSYDTPYFVLGGIQLLAIVILLIQNQYAKCNERMKQHVAPKTTDGMSSAKTQYVHVSTDAVITGHNDGCHKALTPTSV